jgi:hypothetical protein
MNARMSARARIVRTAVVACFALGVGALTTVVTDDGTRPASADITTTAVVVIDNGSSVRSAVIDVGSGVTGLAALESVASVATYGFTGNGAAVCAIDGVGNPADSSCLEGPGGAYWTYWHASYGFNSWKYSGAGAGSFVVHGGDLEGWRYEAGSQAPRASADFCTYVTCTTPTTEAPPPVPAPPAPAGDQGSTSSPAPANPGGASTSSTAPGSAPTGPASSGESPSPATGASSATATTTSPPGAGARNGVKVEAAAARAHDDTGSPVGVVVAAGLLIATVAGAIWLRRRARA